MKTKRRFFAAILAAVFVILNVVSALPALALDDMTARYPTPEGYNDHDYQKLVAFLEQTDANGVKNGKKCSNNYDPNDPTTWNLHHFNSGGWTESDGELRIHEIDVKCNGKLWGTLDVSGCTALTSLSCGDNNLNSLDVTECTALLYLGCEYNDITELDVNGCTALQQLDCYYNRLTELDVSRNTELEYLDCSGNNLSELDLSNTKLPIERIRADGEGYIGYSYRIYAYEIPEVGDDLISYGCDDICAEPKHGESFLGWYNEDGELLSTDAEWDITDRTETVFIAKFTGGEPEIIPGDADGDGELTFNDVTVLYYYLLNGDMTGMTPESLASADLNNDGVVSVSDITLMFNLLLGGN